MIVAGEEAHAGRDGPDRETRRISHARKTRRRQVRLMKNTFHSMSSGLGGEMINLSQKMD
jgi:hypothetical protein